MFLLRRHTTEVDVRPCYVYGAFNAAGEVIYVGMTCDPDERWRQHEGQQPWAHEIAYWDVLAEHPTRRAAKAHETRLIRQLRTRWNIDQSPVAADVRARYVAMFGYVPAGRVERGWPLRFVLFVVRALLWVVWTFVTGAFRLVWVVLSSTLRVLFGVRRRRRRW